MNRAKQVLLATSASVGLAACVGSEPAPSDAASTDAPAASYPALVCDDSRAGELAFGFQRAGAFFAFPGTRANGDAYVFVDHACRYWAPAAIPSEVVTGTLDAELLAEMNADLLTGPWEAVDGEHLTGCCDGTTSGVGRDEIRASAYDVSFERSAALALLIERSARWVDRLGDLGTPVTEGPVRLELVPHRPPLDPLPTDLVPWPLAVSLDDTIGLPLYAAAVHDGTDAALLRGVPRTGTFVDDGSYASFRVVDVVPFAQEDGCVRPFFPGTCVARGSNL